jgi:hypothetical protein
MTMDEIDIAEMAHDVEALRHEVDTLSERLGAVTLERDALRRRLGQDDVATLIASGRAADIDAALRGMLSRDRLAEIRAEMRRIEPLLRAATAEAYRRGAIEEARRIVSGLWEIEAAEGDDVTAEDAARRLHAAIDVLSEVTP